MCILYIGRVQKQNTRKQKQSRPDLLVQIASHTVIRLDFLLVIIIAGFCVVIIVVTVFPVAAKSNLLSLFSAAAAAADAVAAPPVKSRLLLSP